MLNGPKCQITNLKFSNSGEYIASFSIEECQITIWNI